MTQTNGRSRKPIFSAARDRARVLSPRILAALLGVSLAALPVQASEGCFRGINISGAEFGSPTGVAFHDYVYPSEETVRYFAGKGFNSVRVPFQWDRLQPKLNQPLDPAELALLTGTVELLRQYNMSVVLDPHNFAYYGGKQIGSKDLPNADFADFWSRLAVAFKNAPDVSFGLMNEPFDISARQWLGAANAAIAGIRKAGANNLVLVPGTAWTGAHSWEGGSYGEANGTVMLGVEDPADNYAFEVHQYFDDDFSGTKDTCRRATDAVAAVENFTRWLRANGQRGYLGEFGIPAGGDCTKALSDMVAVVEGSRDLWVGWAYWVAGDWWPETEVMNIQPTANGDRPQLAGLARFLKDFSASAAVCPALERR